MKSWNEYIKNAEEELKEKTYDDVHADTALKWGARAYVAYLASVSSDNQEDRISWFLMANEYQHEAEEHAALIKDEERSDEIVETLFSGIGEISDVAFSICAGREDVLKDADEAAASQTVDEDLDVKK